MAFGTNTTQRGRKWHLIGFLVLFLFGSVFSQTTYYSQGSGNFGTLSNWNTVRAGGGTSPADLQQGDIFTIQNGNTITMDNVATAIQSLVIESGGTFDNSSNTISFQVSGGVLDIQSGGTYTASTGTIEHNAGGLGTVTIQATTATILYNVITNGRLTLNGAAFEIDGTLTFNTGQTFTLAGGAAISYGASGVLSYNSNRTIGGEWPVSPASVPYVQLTSNTATISGGTTLIVGTHLTRQNGSITATGTLQYATGATLSYNSNSSKTIGDEWPATNGPENVQMTLTGGSSLSSTGNLSRTIPGDLILNVGTVNLNSGTLTVAGSVVGSVISGQATINDATTLVVGNGAGTNQSQSITGSLTLNQMQVNKAAGADTVTMNGTSALTFTSGGSLTITAGIFDLNGTGRFGAAPATLSIASGGILLTGGTSLTSVTTLSASSGTIVFDGTTAAENLPTGFTIGNVEINNTNGVNASSGTLTIGTNLTLTNGTITTTSTKLLRVGSSASVSGASSSNFVIGPLQKAYATGAVSFDFPVGYTSNYRPATFNYTSNNVGTSIIEVTSVQGDPGGTPPTGTSAIATSHYYAVIERGTSGTFTYNFTGRYTGTGFLPATRNNLIVQSGAGPVYTLPGSQSVNTGNEDVTASGLTVLPTNSGIIAFGQTGTTLTWDGGGGNSNWSTAANWVGDALPVNGDAIVFDNNVLGSNYSVVYDAGVSATSFVSISVAPSGGNSISLSLTKNTTLELTGSSNVLSVASNGTLVFNATNVIMGASYDNTLTNFQSGSTVQYNTGTIYADTYNDLTVNLTSGASSNGAITVNSNLTNSSSATFTLGGNTSVGGNFTNSGDLATSGAFTLSVTGTTNNTGTLTLSGTGAKTFTGTFTNDGTTNASGTGTVNIGNLTLTSGTFTPNTTTNVSGNVSSAGGSFSTSTGTVTFNGSSTQTLSGTAFSANNVTLNNSNNLDLSTGFTIDGNLTFTSGLINTGSNTLTITGSISNASSARYVSGRLAKIYGAGSQTFTYPTGQGGEYLPVTLSFTSLSAGYTRTVEQVNSDAHGLSSSIDGTTLAAISSIRYWEISGTNLTGTMAVTLTWNNNDGVNGSLTALDVAQYNGTNWTSVGGDGSGTVSSGTITSTAFSTNGDYYTFGDDSSNGQENSLPVELTSFKTLPGYDRVTIQWTTESESENLGFNLYRKLQTETAWTLVNTEIIPGQGTYSAKTDYEYVDKGVKAGHLYNYKLESVSVNGVVQVEKTTDVSIPIPDEYVLFNNYPNPFNPTTHLKFQLPEKNDVDLVVYDVSGRVVKTLLNKAQYDAGQYEVTWDATNNSGAKVSSGVYFYRFSAGQYNKMGRMILIK